MSHDDLIKLIEGARLLAAARWGQREPADCQRCGEPVPAASRYRDYCSPRCQVAAWRARRAKS